MTTPPKSNQELTSWYDSYISAINNLPSTSLDQYLTADKPIMHNARPLTRQQYHNLIIPGSVFTTKGVKVDKAGRHVQATLSIEIPDGRRVSESVEYWLDEEGRIERVKSELEWTVGGPDEDAS